MRVFDVSYGRDQRFALAWTPSVGGDAVAGDDDPDGDETEKPMARFARVKQLLDESIDAWKERMGRDPYLSMHSRTFGWADKAQLLASKAFGKQLIADDKVGNGKGRQTELVRALTTGSGRYRQMPSGGPFMAEDEVQEIVDWIDDGCPD